jgi:hypothetical protein
MKIIFSTIIWLVIIIQVSAQMDSEEINKIVNEVRNKFAPDKRTAVFSITSKVEDGIIYLSGETNLPKAKEELFDNLKSMKINDQIALLPSKNLGENIYGIVNLSVVNIRTKPEHSAELATQALLGSSLKILKSNGEWYLVQCEDAYIGWLDDDGLQLMDKQRFDDWRNSKNVIVTASFTNALSERNSNSFPVSDLVAGNLLKEISRDDEFSKVEFPDNRQAYVSVNDIQDYNLWLKSRETSFDGIYATAKSLMGIPYLWGGTSNKGVDCSGFTKIVFRAHGIELPRDASQQVHVGELVDTKNGFSNLIPGDFLFFGSKDSISGKEKITHVAIYIGKLEFIHSSGRVRINSFDKSKSNYAEDRLRTFIKAKRILTSLGRNGVKLTKDIIKDF